MSIDQTKIKRLKEKDVANLRRSQRLEQKQLLKKLDFYTGEVMIMSRYRYRPVTIP